MRIQAPPRILYSPGGDPRVFHAEQADGSNKRLVDFLMWWALYGPWAIVVLEGIRVGVEDEKIQLGHFLAGRSKAKTLIETPHGHAGALDFAVVKQWSGRSVVSTYTGAEKNELDRTEALRRMKYVGECAERFGLEWGGRFPKPDDDHYQVKEWEKLPFPPVLA